jgi:hypothetical protein
MIHKEFWGLLFLGFIAWVFISATPNDRIEKVCRPIGWGGNVVTSLAAMATPSTQTTVQKWFDRLEYGCRYTTWRLFYQSEFNKWKAGQEAQQRGNADTDEAQKTLEGAKESPPGPPQQKQDASPNPEADAGAK